MSAKAWSLLDERLDLVAGAARRVLGVRLAMGLGSAGLVAYIYTVPIAIVWFVAYAATEAVGRWATAPVDRGRLMTRTQRLWQVGSMVTSSAVWCSLSVALWFEGQEAFRLAAMTTLVGLLVHAQGFSFRSPTALAALGTPPAILWFVLPVAFGGYSGAQLLTLSIALAMLLSYVAASTRANMRAANELAEAQQAAETANEAKSAFLAMMSHELRTPMNGVLGMARALQRTPLDQRQQGYVETILKSGDGLMAILNDVLDISKIEAGRMDLEVAAFDLKALGDQAVQLWSEIAASKGLNLTCRASDDLPALVLGDETRVRQIVLNLISNALKFTEAGDITLSMRAAPAADGDGGVEIVVTDTGIGMSADQMALLFRPYAQAEASTARKFGGTGLGLSICRKLSAMMGGEISVTSESGRGSAFRVWLPLPEAEAALADTAEPDALPPLRILVADDNPINQAVARAILEAAGAVIQTASDGSEALDCLRLEAFDLVLMDVNMPVMDGIEAVGRLRAGQAGRADIPVIALTADAMPGEEARLKAVGFDGLQLKPVNPSALITAIADLLDARPSDGNAEAAA